MKVQTKPEHQAIAQAASRGQARAATLEIASTAQSQTAADIKATVEARVRAALEEAMLRERPEIAEPENWWNVYALGPVQPLAFGSPLPPHQIIKAGETAFVATVMVLNPFQIVAPGLSAADLLSSFSLPYEVRYQTGNVTSWTLGQADMNVVHAGPTEHLVPGTAFYVDVLQFTGSTPGLYEMNVSCRLLGATPPFVNAPQFAGFARAVTDLDADLFLAPTPGMQFDVPIRFQVYP